MASGAVERAGRSDLRTSATHRMTDGSMRFLLDASAEAITGVVGKLDAASAVVAANSLDISVLTARPGLYGGLEDGGPIIPVR